MRHSLVSPGPTGVAATALVSLFLLVSACGSPGSPGVPSGSAPATVVTPAATAGPEVGTPLIVDTDMSSDDVLALAYLFGQSPGDLRAVTVSGTGVGRCPPGAANAAALAEELGALVPTACGQSEAVGSGHQVPDPWRDASDGLYGLAVSAATAQAEDAGAVDLMARVLAVSDRPVEILALGPLTNLAGLVDTHPELVPRIGRVVMMGGALNAAGNVGAAVSPGSPEWNVWSDPVAAAQVFSSGVPIVMVPLDATRDVPLTGGVFAELARDHRAGGANLAYELLVRNPFLIGPGQYLWDPLAAVVLGYPEAASLRAMRVRIGTAGEDLGRTIGDGTGTMISVATAANPRAFSDRFYGGLRLSPLRATPFTTAGSLAVTYDGARCLVDNPPAATGFYSVRFTDATATGEQAAIVTLHPGHTWQEVVDFAATIRQQTATPDFVDLTVIPPPSGGIDPILTMPGGTSGVACVSVDADGTTTAVTLSEPFSLEE
jgi:inosine-uridine nucleoside N-ribohydrolase